MKRLIVTILLLCSAIVRAQCNDVQVEYLSSNECLPMATYTLQLTNSSNFEVQWQWAENYPSAQILINQSLENGVSVMMTVAGEYDLHIDLYEDGEVVCQFTETFVVNTPIQPLYNDFEDTLRRCNGNISASYGLLNPEAFISVNWSVTNVNYQGSQIDVNHYAFVQPSYIYISTIDTNGCEYVEEIPLEVIEGPSAESVFINVEQYPTDNCLDVDSVNMLIANATSEYPIYEVNWYRHLYTINESVELVSTSDTFFLPPNHGVHDERYDIIVTMDGCDVKFDYDHIYTIGIDSLFIDYDESGAKHCVPHQFSLDTYSNDEERGIYDYYIEVHWPSGFVDIISSYEDYNGYNYFSDYCTETGYYDLYVRKTYPCVNGEYVEVDTLFEDYFEVIGEVHLSGEEEYLCFEGDSFADMWFTLDNFIHADVDSFSVDSFEWYIGFSGIEEIPEILFSDSDSALVRFFKPKKYSIFHAIYGSDGCEYTGKVSCVVGARPVFDEFAETMCASPNSSFEFDFVLYSHESPFQSVVWSSDSENVVFSNQEFSSVDVSFLEEGVYPISVTVENDYGCFGTITETHVVKNAQADFVVNSDSVVCGPIGIELENFSNNHATNYQWYITEYSTVGEVNEFSFATDDSVFTSYFNTPGISDIELIVESSGACYDTMKIEQAIEVVFPLPSLTLEPNWAGCDTFTVDVIDNSNLIDTFLWVDHGFGFVPDHNVQDTNIVNFTYPYSETDAPFVEYYMEIAAEYNSCFATFKDTVRVYPIPEINISSSDNQGCLPFEVSFEANNNYIFEPFSNHLWEFSDGAVSFDVNPIHTFNQVGVFDVYHSVTSQNGCFNDSLWQDSIEVFDLPHADYNLLFDEFCLGESFAQFESNATHLTDTLFHAWNFQSISNIFNQVNPVVYFPESGTYEFSLMVQDANTCIDDTVGYFDVYIYDDVVDQSAINYVSVINEAVSINWNIEVDQLFSELLVSHRENNSEWVGVSAFDTIFPNQFVHTNVDAQEFNYYAIVIQDSCGYYSDTSLIHSPVVLSVSTNDYRTVDLEWTAYQGWDSIASYNVYRKEVGQEYEWLGATSADELSFVDSNLCNELYTYYIEAIHPDEDYQSWSNKQSIEPMFVNYLEPILLTYSTVDSNEYVVTNWETVHESDLSYYYIDRWDEYFGWQSNYAQVRESPYIDENVQVEFENYKYKVSYRDNCANQGPESVVGTNIVLSASNVNNQYELNWTPYEEWSGGVEKYIVQHFNHNNELYEDVVELEGHVFSYIDMGMYDVDDEDSVCYRIVAHSIDLLDYESASNIKCLDFSAKSYFPTAFTPNGDDLNDAFSFIGSYVAGLDVQIYNRWGSVVFESDQVDFEWDGVNVLTGRECEQGSYIVIYELVGSDGELSSGDLIINLIR